MTTTRTGSGSPARSYLRRGIAALAASTALLFGGVATLPAETAEAAGIAKHSVVLTAAPTVASTDLTPTPPGRKR